MMFHILIVAALLWSQMSFINAAKILVYPIDGSHWINMDALLRELHERGHELMVVRSSNSWYISEDSPHYKSLTIQAAESGPLEAAEFMNIFLKRNIDIRKSKYPFFSFFAIQQEINNLLVAAHTLNAEMVTDILKNKTLIKQLKEAEYDLILVDPGFGGGVVLGSYLGLPLVLNARWASCTEGHFAIAPSPFGYVPRFGSLLSDRMNFWDRLINILHFFNGVHIDNFIIRPPYQSVINEFIGPDANIYSLIQGADLWLMRLDFIFEFPRPTMPNVVYIGGFQNKPAKSLSDDLETFMQSSGEHGVVVMSLGTLLGNLGPEISQVFASAFARLPQKVVWRHLGQKPSTLGNNTLLLDWIPQNDLLGHPKTKVFVTHGGTNGIYEAIYHGVPMLGIPLIFDQFDNMVRLQARGIAEVLDIATLDVETLTHSLKNIMDDKQSYIANMRRMSQLHRDTPLKPMDSAIFWLEFVTRHKGAAHLRTESYKMPWYTYYNVDVLMLLLSVFTVLFLLFGLTCKFLFKQLRRVRKVKKQ